jgi:hypothetical protein
MQWNLLQYSTKCTEGKGHSSSETISNYTKSFSQYFLIARLNVFYSATFPFINTILIPLNTKVTLYFECSKLPLETKITLFMPVCAGLHLVEFGNKYSIYLIPATMSIFLSYNVPNI